MKNRTAWLLCFLLVSPLVSAFAQVDENAITAALLNKAVYPSVEVGYSANTSNPMLVNGRPAQFSVKTQIFPDGHEHYRIESGILRADAAQYVAFKSGLQFTVTKLSFSKDHLELTLTPSIGKQQAYVQLMFEKGWQQSMTTDAILNVANTYLPTAETVSKAQGTEASKINENTKQADKAHVASFPNSLIWMKDLPLVIKGYLAVEGDNCRMQDSRQYYGRQITDCMANHVDGGWNKIMNGGPVAGSSSITYMPGTTVDFFMDTTMVVDARGNLSKETISTKRLDGGQRVIVRNVAINNDSLSLLLGWEKDSSVVTTVVIMMGQCWANRTTSLDVLASVENHFDVPTSQEIKASLGVLANGKKVSDTVCLTDEERKDADRVATNKTQHNFWEETDAGQLVNKDAVVADETLKLFFGLVFASSDLSRSALWGHPLPSEVGTQEMKFLGEPITQDARSLNPGIYPEFRKYFSKLNDHDKMVALASIITENQHLQQVIHAEFIISGTNRQIQPIYHRYWSNEKKVIFAKYAVRDGEDSFTGQSLNNVLAAIEGQYAREKPSLARKSFAGFLESHATHKGTSNADIIIISLTKALPVVKKEPPPKPPAPPTIFH